MKILHSADWHIGNFQGPEREGKNLRSQDTLRCIRYLVDIAIEENPDVVIVAGDLFHDAKVWSARGLTEVQEATKAIKELSERSNVVILRGTPNHDGKEQFEALKEYFMDEQRVYIATEPTVFKITTGNGEAVNLACVPGFDRGEYRSKNPPVSKEEENVIFTQYLGDMILGLRAQCDDYAKKILVTHYTVPGCNLESGQTQFLSQFEPIIEPAILDTAEFDLVALGHIHRPQQLESCKNTFYSGSINANNFNDEGQERGFWIHNLGGGGRESTFHQTPYRKFLTIHLNDERVEAINHGLVKDVLNLYLILDSIVRVKYSCTEGNAKALNKAMLEKALQKAGAFWVAEITPQKIEINANRAVIEKTDPIGNLKEWLHEKAFTPERIDQVVEVATPIVQEALSNTKVARLSGVFEPVEIAVKNYRNYVEETFSFNDINFCTINGRNGAGKSSLFMDAILDCLYEEPREGELTGWIRAEESARSGSITFTFRIGKELYRVTRTRTKSGKATLNLAEFVENQWENRSMEKMKDTQSEVVSVVGMDSLTFRSCALIMQDQYGLFLQADKEKRVQVLSNILGLGMYEEMETRTKVILTETNREINGLKSQITALAESCGNAAELKIELEACESKLESLELLVASANEEKDKAIKELSLMEANQNRLKEIHGEIDAAGAELGTLSYQKSTHQQKWVDIEKKMELVPTALGKIEEMKALEEDCNALLIRKVEYDALVVRFTEKKAFLLELETGRSPACKKAMEHQELYHELQKKIQNEESLEYTYKEWEILKGTLEELRVKQTYYLDKKQEINDKKAMVAKVEGDFTTDYRSRCDQLNHLKKSMEMLQNCECVDIEKASCSFLADAKSAQSQYAPLLEECKAWKQEATATVEQAKVELAQAEAELDALGFNPEEVLGIQGMIQTLEVPAMEYKALEGIKEQFKTVEQMFNESAHTLQEFDHKIPRAKEEVYDLRKEVEELKQVVEAIEEKREALVEMERWKDFQSTIPTLEAERATLKEKLESIAGEEEKILAKLGDLKVKEVDLKGLLLNEMEISRAYEKATAEVAGLSTQKADAQMKLGAVTERLKAVEDSLRERKVLEKEVAKNGEKSAVLELLKGAFSQDGVPHNIIKSLLPHITDIANNILGQMTGGKMGIEFKTEKVLKSNAKKEVVTLDILIEEYGKPPLPYNSKSGGEKVKSALSAILALAETKSTSAGIQLGMLFIDEPPFLDDEGVEAYCDALVTIGERYKEVKIMAITHDPAMKARFPQNLDVVKNADGSKVVMA